MPRKSAHVNAQSIMRRQSVFEQSISTELLVRRWLHQLLIYDRDVPLSQILCAHCKLSRSEEPSLALFRRRAQWSKRKAQIAHRVRLCELPLIYIGHALHIKRNENSLSEELKQRLMRNLFNDEASYHVIGVAVLPLRARLEIQWLVRPTVQYLLSRYGLEHERHNVILRPIVLIA